MPRRVILPGADELFRSTGGPVPRDTEAAGSGETEPASTSTSAVPQPPATRSRADNPTHRTTAARAAAQRHDEKITVYVSPAELVDLEHARLVLRADHRSASTAAGSSGRRSPSSWPISRPRASRASWSAGCVQQLTERATRCCLRYVNPSSLLGLAPGLRGRLFPASSALSGSRRGTSRAARRDPAPSSGSTRLAPSRRCWAGSAGRPAGARRRQVRLPALVAAGIDRRRGRAGGDRTSRVSIWPAGPGWAAVLISTVSRDPRHGVLGLTAAARQRLALGFGVENLACARALPGPDPAPRAGRRAVVDAATHGGGAPDRLPPAGGEWGVLHHAGASGDPARRPAAAAAAARRRTSATAILHAL